MWKVGEGLDAPVIAAIISGLVSLLGIILTFRQQRNNAKEATRRLEEDRAASKAERSVEHWDRLVEQLQEEEKEVRNRLVEAEAGTDRLRVLYRAELERNDDLEERHRKDRKLIEELESKLRKGKS